MSLKTDLAVIALQRQVAALEARIAAVETNSAYAETGIEVRHVGRGKYGVFKSGERVTDTVMTRTEADTYAQNMGNA